MPILSTMNALLRFSNEGILKHMKEYEEFDRTGILCSFKEKAKIHTADP